jgi:aminoglycoside 6-adenylyltransferase
MRNSDEIKKLILGIANADDRIRAVLLNGSRANKNVEPDLLQDFDIVYIVQRLEDFTIDHGWVSVFGEKLIWQLPDEMMEAGAAGEKISSFHYLMLFTDGNRIDLTLLPADKLNSDFTCDSLTVIWLDKDHLFSSLGPPTDKDHLIKRPTQKEFSDACNEFWWVSIYISKGLLRREITYAKEMFENPVRKMFMKIIEWYIGTKTDFSVAFGKAGKHLKKQVNADEYRSILATYPDADAENIWTSLFLMTELFGKFAMQVAVQLNFRYNFSEQENTIHYLRQMFHNRT